MLKIFAELFPLFDYIYLLQTFEYEQIPFLSWYIHNPLDRNLQRKHKLKLTLKALLLTIVSLLIMMAISLVIAIYLFGAIWTALLIFILISSLSPLFIVLSSILFLPIEIYLKRKIIAKAQLKISELTNLTTVAIVGSYAKTSTKNMLYTLLWKDFKVIKTPKSYNTEISIARSILNYTKRDTEVFIAEMDAYYERDINTLCNLVKPKIGLITSIAPQHLERFGSMEKLANTQFEIANNLPLEGTLIINNDDSWSKEIYKQNKQDINEKVMFFSTSNSNTQDKDTFYASNIKQHINGLYFQFHTPTEKCEINLPLIGEHHVMNFVAAASIAYLLGLSLEKIKERAKLITVTNHRLEIINSNNMVIIDNTYNSNPVSAISSLKLLSEFKGKRVLVTPGFIELGEKSFEYNSNFMTQSAKIVDHIIIVGNSNKDSLLSGLIKGNFPEVNISFVNTTKQALNILPNIAGKDKTIVLLENDLPDQYL